MQMGRENVYFVKAAITIIMSPGGSMSLTTEHLIFGLSVGGVT